jgi:superfamily II DNA or RNA helicase|tara:strand:- start:13547 stop:14908 length:1362 start_codon:yes stop_codon:yes gene_type:complete
MIKIELNNKITLRGVPAGIVNILEEELIVDNPNYLDAQTRGRVTVGIPKQIKLLKYNKKGDHYTLPKGYYYKLIEMLRDKDYTIDNRQPTLKSIPIEFKGKLKRDQLRAGMLILNRSYGVLKAPTGSGKTIITLWVIARRSVPTLIVVHTKELMYQWKEKIQQFLTTEPNQIGLIGDGHREFKDITISIVNSLTKIDIGEFAGQVIVDECHRVPSTTFSNAVGKINTNHLLGLTATDKRSDKLDLLIFHYMGGLIHEIKPKSLQEKGRILKPKLRVVKTGFYYPMKGIYERRPMLQKMVDDQKRNSIILREVRERIKKYPRGVALVISDRIDHCKYLFGSLENEGSELLTGNTPSKQRREVIGRLQAGASKVLVATGQLIGEGFDLPSLSSIFLTFPIKFSGRLQQYIGRIVRVMEGKDNPIIYDFSDSCWYLQHSLRKRMEHYEEMEILEDI